MKVVHIISNASIGGAELMLHRLVLQHRNSFPGDSLSVISLSNEGEIGRSLKASGIFFFNLGLSPKKPLELLVGVFKLIVILRKCKPDIVQTWMYHSDLIGGLVAKACGVKKIIWGVRNSKIPQRKYSSTYFLICICALLSYIIPSIVVCCAQSALVEHQKIGYSKKKLVVIPNGYDFSNFKLQDNKYNHLRDYLKIPSDDILIGVIGRFDLLKDHRTFIKAANYVLKYTSKASFLLVGRDISSENFLLMSWIQKTIDPSKFHLMEERNDVPYLLGALDIFCLPSLAEGFPNVLVEAMAMQVPCVATDVGDVDRIMEDCGILVAPGDPRSIADGLIKMIDLPLANRLAFSAQARNLVMMKYSIKTTFKQFHKLYEYE